MSYIDHAGAERCTITEMLVGNASSLHCGTTTFFQKGWSVTVLLVVRFRGQCVPIEQHEPSEEPERYWQDEAGSLFFRDLSAGQQTCAIFGKSWCGTAEAGGLPVRAPPPKTTASFPREAPLVKRSPPAKVSASDQEGSSPDAKRCRYCELHPSSLICLVEGAQRTPQSRKWCKAWEDNMPSAPLKTSGGCKPFRHKGRA